MSSNLDSDHIEPSSPVLHAALASLWRRRVLMVAIAAIALALGIIAILLMPYRYTADAYIRGEFFAAPDTVAKDDESTTAGSMDLDLGRVIETQTRLLLSDQLARRVVQQLGLERLRPLVSKRRLLPPAFFGSAAKAPEDEVGIAATRLLDGLSVENYPRAYLIKVRFSAGDPELAKLIANTFVAELLRSANLQTLFKQRSLAQATLSIQLDKFGDKHPSVAQARMRLAATDALLKEQLKEAPDAILQAAGENVTKAISGAPSSRTFVIYLLLLGGLVIGIGVALWLERGRWWMLFGQDHAGPFVRPTPSR